MAVLSAPAGFTGNDLQSALRQIKTLTSVVTSFQSQNNSAPGLFSNTGGLVPLGVTPGSLNAVRMPDGSISLDVADSSGFGNPVTIGGAAPGSDNYLAPQTHSGAPTTTQFPSAGNFGWYKNTSSGNWYFTLNFGGTLVFQDISTFSGTITDTQHGSRSGGTLHAAATSSTAGFATAAQITSLTATAATVADITSTGTVSHVINGTTIYVNGVPVISARITHIANATTAIDVITQFNALLAALQANNMMSP